MKTRDIEIVTYGEDWKPMLADTEKWLYVFHDKDEGKEPHYHIYTHFKNPRDPMALSRKIKRETGQNALVKAIISKKGAYEYSIHQNEQDKYQYNPDIRVSNDIDWWARDGDETAAVQILQDILNGMNKLTLAKKWGREVIINFSKYKDYADLCQPEEMRSYNNPEIQARERMNQEIAQALKEEIYRFQLQKNSKPFDGTVDQIEKQTKLSQQYILDHLVKTDQMTVEERKLYQIYNKKEKEE